MILQSLAIALQGLAMVAAFTVVPGTTEHGNIRPRDIVSTNIEQSVNHIVGEKGYATTNQVNDAKDSAIDTAIKYTDDNIEYVIEQIEDIQTDLYNYTDKATNATLAASKKYTDNSADTLRDADAKNLTVAFSEIIDATNAVLSSSKSYTDDKIKDITYPVESVNKKTGKVELTADDVDSYTKKQIDDMVDAFSENLADTYDGATNYTNKAIGGIKLPITDPQGSLTNTALTEIKRTIVTDDYFSDIVSELDESFTTYITANNNAIFRDYTNKIAIASHDTLTNANAYTDKKVASVKITETDPVFTKWKNDSYGIAIGNGASIGFGSGEPSIAIGYNCRAKNDSIAIGYDTEAINNGSFAVGSTTYAMGNNAICFGSYAIANQDSLSIGHSINGVGKTINIGNGIMNNSVGSIVITTGTQDGSQMDVTHGDYSITFNSEDSISTTFPKKRRLKALYLGDYNLDELVGDKITNVTKSLDFVKTEEDPKFTAWKDGTTNIIIGANSSKIQVTGDKSNIISIGADNEAIIDERMASGIIIGSGSSVGNRGISIGEGIGGIGNNISLGSWIYYDTDYTNNIVIGFNSGAMPESEESRIYPSIVIGHEAIAVSGGNICIGNNASDNGFGTIVFGNDTDLSRGGFDTYDNRLSAFYIGSMNLNTLVEHKITKAITSSSSQLSITNVAPTTVEHGKFYCFRPTSTTETSITLSPTFNNGKEDEAKLYLDYTTARSNITMADSTITVLYAPNSYKLNAFDAPNGSSNRYLVELKWFATTATEDGTSKKFLVVDAQKVSE